MKNMIKIMRVLAAPLAILAAGCGSFPVTQADVPDWFASAESVYPEDALLQPVKAVPRRSVNNYV